MIPSASLKTRSVAAALMATGLLAASPITGSAQQFTPLQVPVSAMRNLQNAPQPDTQTSQPQAEQQTSRRGARRIPMDFGNAPLPEPIPEPAPAAKPPPPAPQPQTPPKETPPPAPVPAPMPSKAGEQAAPPPATAPPPTPARPTRFTNLVTILDPYTNETLRVPLDQWAAGDTIPSPASGAPILLPALVPKSIQSTPAGPSSLVENATASASVPATMAHNFVSPGNSIFFKYDASRGRWQSATGAFLPGGDASAFAKTLTETLHSTGHIPKSHRVYIQSDNSILIAP